MQIRTPIIYSSGTFGVLATADQDWQGKPTLDLSTLNIIADILWTSSINLAADAECSTENLFNTTLQLLRKRLESHRAGNLDNLVQGD